MDFEHASFVPRIVNKCQQMITIRYIFPLDILTSQTYYVCRDQGGLKNETPQD